MSETHLRMTKRNFYMNSLEKRLKIDFILLELEKRTNSKQVEGMKR